MQTVPTSAVPSQTLSIVLGGQACQIALYSLQTPGDIFDTVTATELQGYPALYMDLTSNGEPVVSCRICRNAIRMLLDAQYLGFVGDFEFIDTLSDTDPIYTGLGSQYQLVYLTPADIQALAA
jgi:hypothetical protein